MKTSIKNILLLACILCIGVTTPAYSFGNLLKDIPGIPIKGGGAQPGVSSGSKPQRGRQKPAMPDVTGLVSAATTTQSSDEEFAVGRQLAGNLLGAAPLVRNPRLQEYVNKVGLWVAMQSERPDIPWRFGVIETDSINAFAAPGGYVFITKGLYNLLRTEEELAGVLGHEIAHIVKQHHWNVIKQQKLVAGATNIATSQIADNAILQKYIGQGAEMLARGLDKNAEYESDRMGVVLARRAGYDASGLLSVLDRIAEKPAKEVLLLYSTHPTPVDRSNSLSDTFAANSTMLDGGKQVNRVVRLE